MSEETPALFADPRDRSVPGSIELAAKESIDAMREFGAIDATHALKIALIMAGARALDREFHRDKVTVAATTLFSRVVDIADGLPTVQQAVSDQFDAIVKALADAD